MGFGRFLWPKLAKKGILGQNSTFLTRKALLDEGIFNQESSPESTDCDESSEKYRRSFLMFFRKNIDGLVKKVNICSEISFTQKRPKKTSKSTLKHVSIEQIENRKCVFDVKNRDGFDGNNFRI